MAQMIDGKKISAEIKEELKEKVASLKAQGKEITLAVIQVGNDPASSVYVGNKKKSCEYIGIRSLAYELPEETTENALLELIAQLNERSDVHGILVQLPVPKHMDEDKIIKAIAPAKDVDGFHPQSVGALSIGQPGFVSCTPAGIIQLLKRSGIEIEGKDVATTPFEIHKKYLDIHVDITGCELIETGGEGVETSYDENRDFGIVECENVNSSYMSPDDFYICMLDEPHKPACAAPGKDKAIKKCIFKVLV